MKISINTQLASRFKFIVHKPSGEKKETDWSDNIVLDNGLNKCAAGQAIDRLYVGSGNSTPSPLQTSLDSIIAFTTTTISISQSGNEITTPPYYSYSRVQFRFAVGVATGNLSEVGLGYNDGSLYNRALITDTNGDPTTITILSDEYLDVVVECREYMLIKYNGSSVVRDKNNIVTSDLAVSYAPMNRMGGKADTLPRLEVDSLLLSSLDVPGSINAYFSNNIGSLTPPASSAHPTLPNARRFTYTAALSSAIGSIKSMLFEYYCLGYRGSSSINNAGCFMQIDPVFNKTNLMEVTFTLDVILSRYEP